MNELFEKIKNLKIGQPQTAEQLELAVQLGWLKKFHFQYLNGKNVPPEKAKKLYQILPKLEGQRGSEYGVGVEYLRALSMTRVDPDFKIFSTLQTQLGLSGVLYCQNYKLVDDKLEVEMTAKFGRPSSIDEMVGITASASVKMDCPQTLGDMVDLCESTEKLFTNFRNEIRQKIDASRNKILKDIMAHGFTMEEIRFAAN